jgi:hypothetical protein
MQRMQGGRARDGIVAHPVKRDESGTARQGPARDDHAQGDVAGTAGGEVKNQPISDFCSGRHATRSAGRPPRGDRIRR